MPRSLRVAIVAVPGIADPNPGYANTAIGQLLANIDEASGPAYERFVPEPLLIPVRRLPIPDGDLHQGSDFEKDAGLAFTASLLANYDPPGADRTYSTTVLRGRRCGHGRDGAAREVDVFELYWADLTPLTENWAGVLAEVYQLLCHVGRLGAHAVGAGLASELSVGSPEHWQRWATAQRRAADLLAREIVLLNLFLAGLVAVLLAGWFGELAARRVVWEGLALAAGVAIAVLCYRRLKGAAIAAASFVALAGAGAFAAQYVAWSADVSHRALATLLLAAVAGAIGFVVSLYERYQPGVVRRALVYGVPLMAFVLFELWTATAPGGGAIVPMAVLHGGEVIYALLRVCWALFLLQAWLAFWSGRFVAKTARGPAADKVARLNWTARFTLAAPAMLLLLLSVVLSASLWFSFEGPVVQGQNWSAPALNQPHDALWPTKWLVSPLGTPSTIATVVTEMVVDAAGPSVAFAVLLISVSVLLLLVGIGPSLLSEILPSSVPRDGTRSGRWLDSGFLVARWAGRLLVLAMLVVLPAGFLAERAGDQIAGWPSIMRTNAWVLITLGTALGLVGSGLLVFRARLKVFTLGLRGALEVFLEIDTYLREYPRDATPRARICTRMASLLRYVYAQEYDAVVMIAHSQGTVITTDVLRFIHMENLSTFDSTLIPRNGRPVYLLTTGAPLRQAYGLRFPYLYGWAYHDDAGSWTDPASTIAATTAPDPAALGVSKWVNAYRGGDYVGRHLWRPDACSFKFDTPDLDTDHLWRAGPFPCVASETAPPLDNRREFCVGAGGHTHYWDTLAPQVGLELDALVRR